MWRCLSLLAPEMEEKKWKSNVKKIVEKMRLDGWECFVEPSCWNKRFQISAMYRKTDLFCVISYEKGSYCLVRFQFDGAKRCASGVELHRLLSGKVLETLTELSKDIKDPSDLRRLNEVPEDTNNLTTGHNRPHPQ